MNRKMIERGDTISKNFDFPIKILIICRNRYNNISRSSLQSFLKKIFYFLEFFYTNKYQSLSFDKNQL